MSAEIVPITKRRYDAASKTTRTTNWQTPATDATSAISNPALIRFTAAQQLRKIESGFPACVKGSLPHRQLRKICTAVGVSLWVFIAAQAA